MHQGLLAMMFCLQPWNLCQVRSLWHRDLPGYFLTMRQQVEVETVDKPPPWKFQEAAPLRTHLPLITADNVSFAYPPASGSSDDPKAKGTVIGCRGHPHEVCLSSRVLCIKVVQHV